MKCPACADRVNIQIASAEGFTSPGSPLKECGKCGLLWRVVPGADNNKLEIIKIGKVSIKMISEKK